MQTDVQIETCRSSELHRDGARSGLEQTGEVTMKASKETAPHDKKDARTYVTGRRHVGRGHSERPNKVVRIREQITIILVFACPKQAIIKDVTRTRRGVHPHQRNWCWCCVRRTTSSPRCTCRSTYHTSASSTVFCLASLPTNSKRN